MTTNEKKEVFHNFLTVGVLTACFVVLIYILHIPKAERTDDAGDIKMLCITTITAIVSYMWGSSRGSQKSGDAIRQLVNPPDGTTTMTTKSPTPEGQENKID